jgi:DNA-binding NarL/FixJ family response regulator
LSGADLRDLRRYAWPLLWWGLRIEADVAERARDQGAPEEVDRSSQESLLALAADLPVDSPSLEGYRALACAEVARGDAIAAEEAWSQCVAVWRTAGEPHPLAYALLRSGEAALAVGNRPAATAAVAEAVGIAASLGASSLLAEAQALSRRGRLGDPPPTADPTRQDVARLGLTSREIDVLRLLASGRTNAQIAGELFISPKTVSVHVSNILAKLGVARRVEAAGVAYRLGLATTK